LRAWRRAPKGGSLFLVIAASQAGDAGPVLYGDPRSRLPLRGSPGFTPGSLLIRSGRGPRSAPLATPLLVHRAGKSTVLEGGLAPAERTSPRRDNEPTRDRAGSSLGSRTNPTGTGPDARLSHARTQVGPSRSSSGSRTNPKVNAHDPPWDHARTELGSRTPLLAVTHEPKVDRARPSLGSRTNPTGTGSDPSLGDRGSRVGSGPTVLEVAGAPK
jgi:hypothetical protein